MTYKKAAIVLFNLGGPDSLASIRPFLFNLFNDESIIPWPKPLRWLLAKFISWAREKKAISIYKKLGGRSPLLENTYAQAEALQKNLIDKETEYRVFVAMRYWHPLTQETLSQVKAFAPDDVVLLPLYPQFSTTTTGSSLKEWQRLAKAHNFHVPYRLICCYFQDDLFIQAHVEKILPFYQRALVYGQPRILFSAHGLPQEVINKGDPYQWQIEKTAEAIIKRLRDFLQSDVDYRVCYQSRVGPKKWLEPTTEFELEKAAFDKVPVLVVPISFVSEHSETLVELDMDYKEIADELEISFYGRVPSLSCDVPFISALAERVKESPGGMHCPCSSIGFIQCPCRQSL